MSKGHTLSKNTLSKNMAENWKLTSLAKFDADEWLLVNSDKKGIVISLSWKVCKSYFKFVKTMRNFSNDWATEGSTNLQLSNAERHPMTLYWKEVKLTNKLCDKNQETITSGIASMQGSQVGKMKKKVEISFLLAKVKLIKLEENMALN